MIFEDIQLIIGENENAIKFLEPYIFDPGDGATTDDIIRLLYDIYQKAPNNLFIILAFNKRNDELLAYSIAFLTHSGDCFSLQTWAKDTLSSRLVTHKVIVWAGLKGCKKIRMQTSRNAKAMARVSGMRIVASILSVDLTDEYEKFLADKVTREINHGRQ